MPKLDEDGPSPTNEDLKSRIAELTRELEVAVRVRDDFLPMLARHLRRSLVPIQNGVELLRLFLPEDEHLIWARAVIDRHVECLVRLVETLLDVSRVTEGKIELRWDALDLRVVLARAVEASSPLVHAHGHTLKVSLPPDPLCVSGDLVRLAQAVANLLHNVAKYTTEGREISLQADREGDEAVIQVRYVGAGIPTELDRFAQGKTLFENADWELEFGLAFARRIVELHCGMIQARRAGPGKGSEFLLRLSSVGS